MLENSGWQSVLSGFSFAKGQLHACKSAAPCTDPQLQLEYPRSKRVLKADPVVCLQSRKCFQEVKAKRNKDLMTNESICRREDWTFCLQVQHVPPVGKNAYNLQPKINDFTLYLLYLTSSHPAPPVLGWKNETLKAGFKQAKQWNIDSQTHTEQTGTHHAFKTHFRLEPEVNYEWRHSYSGQCFSTIDGMHQGEYLH